jgi:hypothetical protein
MLWKENIFSVDSGCESIKIYYPPRLVIIDDIIDLPVCGRSFLIKEAVLNCEEVDYSNEEKQRT